MQAAVEQYQQALTLRPGDATVENALGGALLASDRIPEAIAQLTAAVNVRPEYFDAHYNLGIAQAMAGNFPAAVQELAIAVKLKPDDAGAEANLGAAYGELGDTQKAIMHLNRALQLDPGQRTGKRKSRSHSWDVAPTLMLLLAGHRLVKSGYARYFFLSFRRRHSCVVLFLSLSC